MAPPTLPLAGNHFDVSLGSQFRRVNVEVSFCYLIKCMKVKKEYDRHIFRGEGIILARCHELFGR